MKRYLRLYLHFLRFSFTKAMEFRLDFTFRIFMDIIYYLVNIFFFKIIYLHTPMLGGWREDQVMVFVGGYLLVDSISMTVFSTNMWWLPASINKGELDYYLLRPVSPLFFLSLREFAANSFLNLIIALGFFIYSLTNLQGSISPLDMLLYALLLLNGALIYYCLQLLTIIPVFWTHSARGFSDLFYSMTLAIERPDKIFTRWMRPLFTIILPFSLIASFPTRLFLDGFEWKAFLHLSAVTVGLWIIMLLLWKAGLRNYSSASS